MVTRLSALKIKEISSVDRGAGEGVKIMLMKRAAAMRKDMYGVSRFGDIIANIGSLAQSAQGESIMEGDNSPIPGKLQSWLRDGIAIYRGMTEEETSELLASVSKAAAADDAAIDAYMKRDFSDAKRKELAASGAAMPGGGYPIETTADLHNAIQAFGRAKDKPKTKAHIISRAKALGATGELPEGWVGKSALADPIVKAMFAASESIASIRADDGVIDKAAMIAEQIADFRKFLDGAAPAEVIDALAATLGDAAPIHKEITAMTEEERKAEEKKKKDAEDKEKAEKAVLTKALADVVKLTRENAILKLSEKHKAYMDDAEMDDGEKEKFLSKSPDERDEHMKKNPIEKRLPAAVQAVLAKAAENDAIIKTLREKDDIATFAKRAVAIGLTESEGEMLRKAANGDKTAFGEIEKKIGGLNKALTDAGFFKEIGSSGHGEAGTATQEMNGLADTLRKAIVQKGEKCSPAQAFTKVYLDPANAGLKKRYDHETEVAKRSAA